jgi:hypothetical protein
VFLLAAGLRAQAVLDVVDGETLYEGGHLVSFSSELVREEILRRGDARTADAAASHRYRSTSTLAWLYGLRHDLQVGIALPYVDDEREFAGGQQAAAGIGDVELLAKWRVHRWHAPGVAVNTSLIATLSLPTGDDDHRAGSQELEPEQQLGSGGIDPAIGFAITPEPGRWRFNAAVLYRFRTDTCSRASTTNDATGRTTCCSPTPAAAA